MSTSRARAALQCLEQLHFDNRSLRHLPVEEIPKGVTRPEQRSVSGACFSLVEISPLTGVKTVGVSSDALRLLGIDDTHKNFAEYMSGSKVIPGSQPAAHCYCGHQFGNFAGQLGDGATMYLGEIKNSLSERWELQIKGGGKTPFSRTADGRKVLRSSLREFLCSEAMFYLGVPTTRSGSLITSTNSVIRDIKYDGNARPEACAVITRIAQSFIRFGSFEICNPTNEKTDRAGPSAGDTTPLKKLIAHTCESLYGGKPVQECFSDIVTSTAYLVAKWQSIGWCHGVLNTDNMSILGLTIDYGPYGFIDHFDKQFICNGSDQGGRYDYESQPTRCKWNLQRLSASLQLIHPELKSEFEKNISQFDSVYERFFYNMVGQKLGLVKAEDIETDETGRPLTYTVPETVPTEVRELVDSFFETMNATRCDFSEAFRCLTSSNPLEKLLQSCASPETCIRLCKAKGGIISLAINANQLRHICMMPQVQQALDDEDNTDPSIEMIREERNKFMKLSDMADEVQALKGLSAEQKQETDKEKWKMWLQKYDDHVKVNDHIKQMNSLNPVFILRQWILQKLIEDCENGNYNTLHRVLERMKTPFTHQPLVDKNYSKQPEWSSELCVT